VRVWLEDWEWKCCGEPFALGAKVEWGLLPVSDDSRAYLGEPLGAEVVGGITHCETHHEGDDDEPPVPTRGRVESITAAYWYVAPRPGGDQRVHYPVAGSAILEERDKADGWEPEIEGGPRFEGYIVELAPLD
jgi:hypothetical protein